MAFELNLKRVELDHMNKEPEYGWLSPLGDFIKADWGQHEKTAYKIIKDHNWDNEYDDWYLEKKKSTSYFIHYPFGDFLSEKKGWVLIDDAGYGLSVTNLKLHGLDYTKRQKEFLYSYFIDLGCPLNANYYYNEGENK